MLVTALVAVGFLLPQQVRGARRRDDAPQATVFTVINGFRHFNRWSPWAGVDPGARYTYAGPESGVGARMSWVGDPGTVGSGSLAIVETRPFETVKMALAFGPMGIVTATYRLAPEGSRTRLTWALDTDTGANPLARYMGLEPSFDSYLSAVTELSERVSIPKYLTDIGVARQDFQRLAIMAMPDFNTACNPRTLDVAALVSILEAAS